MSTLTLGIIVIIYMFVIAWLGYLGYRQTKNASDYLLGGRKVNPIIMADRKSTRLNSSHTRPSRMPSSA